MAAASRRTVHAKFGEPAAAPHLPRGETAGAAAGIGAPRLFCTAALSGRHTPCPAADGAARRVRAEQCAHSADSSGLLSWVSLWGTPP
eukprot:CAMPEP_0176244926 /NCGR_PEP_ID=MMETSP0121_2-20121125/31681_1 /TAXON_ID=160619 /ORGANISM="Kryptoperidinium foliaceum, Strain CCMP 1326" /LENGTH=87 /DNA_ID=CAMNT_0017584545 /DNA_START=221 /DNA_END=480 /DNA_ORIENTATION=+